MALLVGSLALVAASGTVAADQHERENAPTYETSDGGVNFTINLPERTDHYPGDQNEANASIEYLAAGEAAFTDQDAEEGLWLDIIIVEASWIDYSECTTSGNTKEFGIDRGNNNSGFQSDEGESLLDHQKGSDLEAGGLTVYFYNWEGINPGPPYLAPEDAVVASQGVGSNDGPCLTMTDEPGWYQIQGYTNGTIATKCKEETNDTCEPIDKQRRGLNINSNYVYVCECNSEQEARQKLGPPPSEDGSSGREGGVNGEGTETPDDGGETATPGGGGGASDSGTPTPTEPPSTPTATSGGQNNQDNQDNQQNNQNSQQSNQQNNQQSNQQNNQQNNQNNQQDNERTTPTISDGPGFTPVVALLALLAAALVAHRRS